MRRRLILLAATALVFLSPLTAASQWVEGGLELADPGYLGTSRAVSDGAGGMICVYIWNLDGAIDIHAQRIDGYGNLLWGAGGVPVCTQEPGDQFQPAIAPDGNGGAYIAWKDERDPSYTTIYAQHLDADGAVSYPVDGIPMVTGVNFDVSSPRLAATADGGAVVTWRLEFSSQDEVRAQKLTPGGYQWSFGGETLRTTSESIFEIRSAELHDGSIAVVYAEQDPVLSTEIWSAGLQPDGSVMWSRREVRSGPGPDTADAILADPWGGFYVAGATIPVSTVQVYVNRMNDYGTALHAGGVIVCTEPVRQYYTRLAPAEDGLWIAWVDLRNPTEDAIFVQRATRNLDMVLPANGRQVVQDADNRFLDTLLPDGNGGALLSWRDLRWGSGSDIFVQRITSGGDTVWPSTGVCLRVDNASNYGGEIVGDGAGGLICAFDQSVSDDSLVFIQRVERHGHWGYPAPSITSIHDVPADQGGEVLLSWDASRLDAWPEQDVTHYTLWRALPDAAAVGAAPRDDWVELVAPTGAAKAASADGPVVRADLATASLSWLLLDTVDAYLLPAYAHQVPTFTDSTAADPADQVFQVIAHGSQSDAFWISPPATGRSVDNLAPGTPLNLVGTADYSPEGMDLAWSPVAAPDLAHYVVYRGTTADFVPSRFNLVAVVPDTTVFDTGWDRHGTWHYKVAAVDAHGNAGDYATLGPAEVSATGDGGVLPARTALLPNRPNPFNPATSVRYQLAADGPVRIRVYDAAGRLVRTLVDAPGVRGRHAVDWDGRDGAGRQVASGVYICRLEAGDEVRVNRMTLVK